MQITTQQAVAAMQKYGGNGMQKLAACWLALDSDKRMRLELAFNAEFQNYREMAEQENRQAA
ncbi:hypothetical protein LMG26685_02913 [Achromobacter mucicolens]|uniref:hypothetical protein n=1 Tax=Achromobacter mucicolens TaxID=1389922 RepID=UPI0009C7E427|nr:hypothetical protein [Achromobacter mucicolens]CAB3654226.1 hypothetical protein LMG26685_02913 [Achromobacter mucicolens]